LPSATGSRVTSTCDFSRRLSAAVASSSPKPCTT
jgi:hypothetical protein